MWLSWFGSLLCADGVLASAWSSVPGWVDRDESWVLLGGLSGAPGDVAVETNPDGVSPWLLFVSSVAALWGEVQGGFPVHGIWELQVV